MGTVPKHIISRQMSDMWVKKWYEILDFPQYKRIVWKFKLKKMVMYLQIYYKMVTRYYMDTVQ